jgi:DUF1680 family protein
MSANHHDRAGSKNLPSSGEGLQPVSWKQVRIDGGFWQKRQLINRSVTLVAEYNQLERTGRIDSLRLKWKPGDPQKPHHYWDSDVAKWIEAAAYTLALESDPELERKVDAVIDLIAASQQPDGYLNTYFSTVEPGKRWTNVYVMHELYCAGHLIEAAVAYYEALGKRKLLDVLLRYVDHIDSCFGPEEGKIHGYPGHEEIELALVKLYRITGEKRYLRLAKFFIDERGKVPSFFEEEARARGEDPDHSPQREILNRNYLAAGPYALFQAHLPVREQKTAEGHAVRAMYLYSAMVDVGNATGDDSLIQACRILWDNVTRRRMYITGGVGSSEFGERFTFDYDLPNETAYNETCAAIGLVFWAHRMIQTGVCSEYADILERALYNGILSGVSLTGDTFFYANHLAVCPDVYENRINRNPRMLPRRQSWFEVSCCPPNLARLLASLGGYIYSVSSEGIYVHLYITNTALLETGEKHVEIRQETEYPWTGHILITVSPEEASSFTLFLRMPGWSEKYSVLVNGEPLPDEISIVKGYIRIKRRWQPGDTVTLDFDMQVRLIEAHPAVREDCGRVAFERGPIVYCLEEVDNGKYLWDILLPSNPRPISLFEQNLLGGIVTITADAFSREVEGWNQALYRPAGSSRYLPRKIKAVPYFAWSNRSPGEMLVWIGYSTGRINPYM